ncbi:MAG: choice-of-anchor M domain-containing protein [Opitutales bacterium]|nr:choice-of-anchor M domain-containing protein [Opitutales bacterium]
MSTQHSVCLLAAAFASSAAGATSSYTVISSGHYDLGAHYDPDSGWHGYVWDFEARKALDAERTVLWAGPEYRREVPAANFDRLADPGSTVWVLPDRLPDHLTWDEFLYLGLGTQQQEPGVFRGGANQRGEKAMRLVSVEGSGVDRGGHFAMWYTEGLERLIWIFTTRDGIDESDRFEELRAGFHGHYNTGFSQPGRYDVTVEFYGDLREAYGGGSTAHEVTWTFYVSDGSMDWAQAIEADDGWYYSPAFGWLYPVDDRWVHSADHGFWYVRPKGNGVAYVFDPQWDSWVFHSADLHPWAYDAELGWVTGAEAGGRWHFVEGNGWRIQQRS